MTINKFCIRRQRVRIAITSAVVVFLLFASGEAVAQTATDSVRTWKHEGTTVTLSGTTLRVSGKGEMGNYVIGSPWHEVAATCAIIEDGVTHIGGKAFMFMRGLKSVTIANSVTAIEEEAFRETGLTSIDIPGSVKSIYIGFSQDAFSGCADLVSINVAPDNTKYSSEDGVLFNKDKTALLLYPMGKKGAYKIPGSVKAIGHRAFARNLNITSITIPGSVESISTEAFAACDSLISVTIEEGVKSIEYLAFWGCDNLKYVTIPRSVTDISSKAFAGCVGLMSITVADDNPNYSSEDGSLFNKSKTVLIQPALGKFSASNMTSNASNKTLDIARYKMIALYILTALVLFAVIFVIIKKTPKLSGRRRALFIGIAVALSAFALFEIHIYSTTFSLKIKINPKKGGTVSPAGTHRHKAGRTVTVMAEQSDGYVFTGWSGASTLTINPLRITMDGDKILTANFELFEPRFVQIGNRRWMAENINIIPSKPWCYYDDCIPSEPWCYYDDNCIFGKSWCYDNDESNCKKYGRLYDWYAAMAVCPAGWRLPTKDDWNSLIRAGGHNTGKKLKSKTGWDDWECKDDSRNYWGPYYGDSHAKKTGCTPGNTYSGNGTDDFGFSALPGGDGKENDYRYIGKFGEWWTNVSSEWYELDWYSYDLEDSRCIGGNCGSDGKSVRCVQDIPGVPEKVVGFDDPPPPIVRSWKSGATTVTYYTDGLVRVSGNGEMENCYPPWREYSRSASMADCNSPWRDYAVAGLIIEDGVTHIGSHAFDGCYAMSYVAIPSSVTSIGGRAFHYCTSLRSIIIRNPNPPRIATMIGNASDVFEENYENIMEKACLYVPADNIDAYRAARGWGEFGCVKELAEAPGGK